MVKLISAILSLSMLFGTGAAPNSTTVTANAPVTVGAQQAVYEKWTAVEIQKPQYYWTFQYFNHGGGGKAYSDCLLDAETGKELMINEIESSVLRKGDYYWSYYGSQQIILRTTVDHDGDMTGSMYKAIKSVRQIPENIKGKYLTDITAVNGSFPADGRHSDGFWYVFKNLVED